MKKALLMSLFFAALLGAPRASSGVSLDDGQLEANLREQLSRMFEDQEYFLDVQLKGSPEVGTVDEQPLPGIGYTQTQLTQGVDSKTGLYTGVTADVLLVIDTEVSKDRLKLADEVARRVIGSAGLAKRSSVKVRQQQIAKVEAKPELAKPIPEKTFWDQLAEHKDMIVQGAAMLWAALVSLMAVYGVVRKISHAKPAEIKEGSGAGPARMMPPMPGEDSKTNPSRAKALTKDELYSKDQALLNQVADIVGEAKAYPAKVAKVLTRWVGMSDENARYASIMLKNCDIRTVEAVSALLHPSDIEKIIGTTVDDFDAFSPENRKVLELMRSDLALLSAERVYGERPDPMNFARVLSEDDVFALVRDESLDIVAMVSTQIPPHRMQKYYASLDTETLNELCNKISNLEPPTIDDFQAISDLLQKKAKTLGSALFDDKLRVKTLTQLMQVLSSPQKLHETAMQLRLSNAAVYALVRPKVILPCDLNFLSQRATTVIAQAVDADILAVAVGGLGLDFTRLADQLPEAYGQVFRDKLRQEVDQSVQDPAWQRVLSALRDLVANGLMSDRELAAAKALADEAPVGEAEIILGARGEAA